MFNIDLAFPHNYEVEEIPELPGTGKFRVPLHYFPGSKTGREHDGLWLKVVTQNGASWVGVFGFGYESAESISRVVSSPDPDRICVVCRGAAYIVKVDEPDMWDKVPLLPVTDIRFIPDHQFLLFADFSTLAAYGHDGLIWESPRLCWDELKILRITDKTIEGVGYNPIDSRSHESTFAVDIKTGRSLLPVPVSMDGKPVW